MCGIGGIFGRGDRETLRAMLGAWSTADPTTSTTSSAMISRWAPRG